MPISMLPPIDDGWPSHLPPPGAGVPDARLSKQELASRRHRNEASPTGLYTPKLREHKPKPVLTATAADLALAAKPVADLLPWEKRRLRYLRLVGRI